MGAGGGGICAQETVVTDTAHDAGLFAAEPAVFGHELNGDDDANEEQEAGEDNGFEKLVHGEGSKGHGVGSFPVSGVGGRARSCASSATIEAGTESKRGWAGG